MSTVVYLTGAPASGKSTLAKLLRESGHFQVFVYSEEIAKLLTERRGETVSEFDLRTHSSRLITPDDIAEIDRRLEDYIEAKVGQQNILVDCHAVTKEVYGFRITPFGHDQVRRLRLTHIVMLYAHPNVIRERIEKNAQGRPQMTFDEAQMITMLQSSVPVAYASSLGIPMYCMDSSQPPEHLAELVCQKCLK